ncbi:ATP-binding protein [Tsukamurella pseudospumae]|nr:ATP-binding protein [Tsukamurella pseudospumae]
MEALTSQGYGFEAAIADLVDNSIDAGAHDVVIHFLRDEDNLVSLLVIDDGCGMDAPTLDIAMTVGARRDYTPRSLGMFGTGLKSASLSHADAVTVASRTKNTRPVGRRWAMKNALNGFQCDIVDNDYAQTLIDRYNGCPIGWHGTVVRWDDVKDFPQIGDTSQTDRYLTRTISRLGLHLGLQFHRFLADDRFNITIAVEDVASGTQYMNFGVEPLNPFGYPVTGNSEYPRAFTADLPGTDPITLNAHIWTPRSNLEQYRSIGSVLEKQGFYFYRNNRLVQAGGWNNYRQPEQHLSLARVAIDIPDGSSDIFRLTVKKDGVETSPAFIRALDAAHDNTGRSFSTYIEAAQATYRDARKRSTASRKPVLPPGSGIDPAVKISISQELQFVAGEDPIAIRWSPLEQEIFFEIDRDSRIVHLNKKYRSSILGGRNGSLNDAPLVKALMYLLLHKTFEGEYSGARTKDNLKMWQTVLTAAAEAEIDKP